MDDTRNDNGRLTRVALIIGALAAIATILGVLWTIFNHENTEVADYQNQVLATCQGVQTVLAAPHNETWLLEPGNLLIRKAMYVNVLRSNLERAHSSFDSLNAKAVPASLTAQADAAKGAQAAWYTASELVIAAIDGRRRPTIPAVDLPLQHEFVDSLEATMLNSAMTALAGKSCQIGGASVSYLPMILVG